jgi:hypothetical protein
MTEAGKTSDMTEAGKTSDMTEAGRTPDMTEAGKTSNMKEAAKSPDLELSCSITNHKNFRSAACVASEMPEQHRSLVKT